MPTTQWKGAIPTGWGTGWLWARVVGIIFLLLLLIFVTYSALLKEWCLQRERGWGGAQHWGAPAWGEQDLGECRARKSWFSF